MTRAFRSGRTESGKSVPPQTSDYVSKSTLYVLERARSGDRSALLALIERSAPPVHRWARGRLPHYLRGDANTEDIVQDAVLQTVKRIERLRNVTVGGVQAYLRRSVVNRIRDLIRRTKRHGISVDLDESINDELPSPLELAIKQQRHDRFLKALHLLKPTDRQVIIWRIELGYSVDDIAQRLGKSKAATGMTVGRAITKLASTLEVTAPETK